MRSSCLPLLAALLLLPASAAATTVVPATRATLAARSQAVVRARVLSQAPARSAASGRPLTVTRLQVLESYRGRLAGVFELEQLGGPISESSMRVEGDARLSVGEEVVLFVKPAGARWRIVGLGLGKYAVRRDANGKRIAVREPEGLVEVGGNPLAADVVELGRLAREIREAR